jgi:peptidylglycine monooxygenase
MLRHVFVTFLTIAYLLHVALCEDLGLYPVIMPRVVPSSEEVYLCTMVDVSQYNGTIWIRGFHPKVNVNSIHHMILAGCKERPAATRFNLWNCGGSKYIEPSYPIGPVCPPEDNNNVSSGSSIAHETTIYLWGLGGKPLLLPEGVGFKMGSDSRIKYLVLQTHYVNLAALPDEGDSSGVYLHYTRTPQPKTAGMISVHVNTMLPPRTISLHDASCNLVENKVNAL